MFLPRLPHLPLQNTAIQGGALEDVRGGGGLYLRRESCDSVSSPSSSPSSFPFTSPFFAEWCASLALRKADASASRAVEAAAEDEETTRPSASTPASRSAAAIARSRHRDRKNAPGWVGGVSVHYSSSRKTSKKCERKRDTHPIHLHIPSLTRTRRHRIPNGLGLVGAVLALLGGVLPGTALHRREGGAEGVDGGVTSA
ncbi:hypothetical protein B0H16DRAFT_1474273 [Mycena metata]|uniref:Uncharacterized protein n=1 Tax=Mycena metata TaxID=1033252 RepID=A0AAD7MJX6_9AGAR|nr:hypothetical protein B0H16DRAFT_1474273 [Mycena metata]